MKSTLNTQDCFIVVAQEMNLAGAFIATPIMVNLSWIVLSMALSPNEMEHKTTTETPQIGTSCVQEVITLRLQIPKENILLQPLPN